MSTLRGAVSSSFPVDGCVDGSTIWVRNTLDVPIHLSVGGDTGTITRGPFIPTFTYAATITRKAFPDPYILEPSDVVRVAIGSKAATVTVEPSAKAEEAYILSTAFADVESMVSKPAGAADAIAEVVRTVQDEILTYFNCLPGKNPFQQLGCFSLLAGSVRDTVLEGLLSVFGDVTPLTAVLAKILTLTNLLKFQAAIHGANQATKGPGRTLAQAAAPRTDLTLTVALDDLTGGYPVNLHPVHTSRPVTLSILNAAGSQVFRGQLTATHVAGSDHYVGTVTLPAGWTTGSYVVSVRMDYTLARSAHGVVITAGQKTAVPRIAVVVGDVNQDGSVNPTDYQLIQNCASDLGPPTGPCDSGRKRAADLDDNGVVNIFDLNLYLRQAGRL